MFSKKDNVRKFTGKHLCQSVFFNEVAGLGPRCFPVNFAKFLRTPFLTEHLWWLLERLYICYFMNHMKIIGITERKYQIHGSRYVKYTEADTSNCIIILSKCRYTLYNTVSFPQLNFETDKFIQIKYIDS